MIFSNKLQVISFTVAQTTVSFSTNSLFFFHLFIHSKVKLFIRLFNNPSSQAIFVVLVLGPVAIRGDHVSVHVGKLFI